MSNFWAVSHPDDLSYKWTLQYVIQITYDIALCHSDEIINLIPTVSRLDDLANGSISSRWLMDIAGCHPDDLRCCHMSSGWHNVIWIISHPTELAPDRISSRWLMANTLCHPDDLAGVCISSGWIMANSLYHPDDIRSHSYVIRMTHPSI